MLVHDDIWPLIAGRLARSLDTPGRIASMPAFSGGLLELRLGGRGEPIDFAARVDRKDLESPGFAALAERIEHSAHPDALATTRFLRLVSAAAPDRMPDVPGELWFEFDTPFDPAASVPNLFWRLAPDHARVPFARPDSGAEALRLARLHTTTFAALGRTVEPTILARVLAALPTPASFRYLGVMLQRDAPGVRLTLGTFPLNSLRCFLAAIDFPHPTERLVPTLACLERVCRVGVLHLDLATEFGPALGIELAPEAREPAAGRTWERILDTVASIVNVDAATRQHVLAWPGEHSRFRDAETWARIGAAWNQLRLYVNHAKLTIHGGVESPGPTAKAYLAYEFNRVFPGPALW